MQLAMMRVAALSVALLVPVSGMAQAPAGFGTPTASHGRIETDGAGWPLTIRFEPAEWPNIHWQAPEGRPWDWSRHGALLVELQNPGEETIEFHLRIDDDPSADGMKHCRTATGTIAPTSQGVFSVDLGVDPMTLGMRALPTVPGTQTLTANVVNPLETPHIVGFQLFLHAPTQPVTLRILSLDLAPAGRLDGMVDQFGQYAYADWPGKIHQVEQLVAEAAAEKSDLSTSPAMPGRCPFGGWAEGPKREPTGFFRVEKVDGRWWFVDPDGHLFFSSGIDCVGQAGETMITGRESLFSWIPKAVDPEAAFLGQTSNIHRGPVTEGQTFDFYRANLRRKYGASWPKDSREAALSRLPSWGFNTIGNWSSWDLYRNGRVPYVATAGIDGPHPRISSGSDYWGQMHDPFDPQFAADVKNSLKHVVDRVKSDPWCLGYFVDNELSWGGFDLTDAKGRTGLAIGALQSDPTSAARRELIAQLKTQYQVVERLNNLWGMDFADWKALESGEFQPPSPLPPAMEADFRAFVKSFAVRYFSTIRDELKRLDPDHLYLGCRFAWKTREAIEAAAETCQVVSFNIYDRAIDPKKWSILAEIDRPCLIGEFHVGALDRGMFHPGLVSAADQAERSRVFQAYVNSALENPAIVGCHWFQYVDEPITGRSFDGENYNIGFVTCTDSPYPEMREAARAVHRGMYERHVRSAR
jgi:hypothetical protein